MDTPTLPTPAPLPVVPPPHSTPIILEPTPLERVEPPAPLESLQVLSEPETPPAPKTIKREIPVPALLQNIKMSEFCGLIHAKTWHDWLSTTTPDLHQDLQRYLGSGDCGCHNNNQKMQNLFSQVIDRGLERKLLHFLFKNHPQVVISWNKALQPYMKKPI